MSFMKLRLGFEEMVWRSSGKAMVLLPVSFVNWTVFFIDSCKNSSYVRNTVALAMSFKVLLRTLKSVAKLNRDFILLKGNSKLSSSESSSVGILTLFLGLFLGRSSTSCRWSSKSSI